MDCQVVEVNLRPVEVELEVWEVGGSRVYSTARSVFYEGAPYFVSQDTHTTLPCVRTFLQQASMQFSCGAAFAEILGWRTGSRKRAAFNAQSRPRCTMLH
eukprot:1031538-Amphidinium_carterae.1